MTPDICSGFLHVCESFRWLKLNASFTHDSWRQSWKCFQPSLFYRVSSAWRKSQNLELQAATWNDTVCVIAQYVVIVNCQYEFDMYVDRDVVNVNLVCMLIGMLFVWLRYVCCQCESDKQGMYLNLVSSGSILGLRKGSPMNGTCRAMDCERKDTGWVGTSVKMLADLLLLFPPAATPPTPGQDIENKNSSYLM